MKTVNEIIQELDRATAQLPVDQLLSELQIVVERVSFTQLQNRQAGDRNDISIAQLNMLFEDEVSTEMLGYLQWLSENKMLHAVADNNGLLFLNYCIKKYKQMTQVRFTSAIPLSEQIKSYVRYAILSLYPSGARIIFETNPSITAGFVIDDGSRTVNRSLKNLMQSTLRDRVAQSVQGVVHG